MENLIKEKVERELKGVEYEMESQIRVIENSKKRMREVIEDKNPLYTAQWAEVYAKEMSQALAKIETLKDKRTLLEYLIR